MQWCVRRSELLARRAHTFLLYRISYGSYGERRYVHHPQRGGRNERSEPNDESLDGFVLGDKFAWRGAVYAAYLMIAILIAVGSNRSRCLSALQAILKYYCRQQQDTLTWANTTSLPFRGSSCSFHGCVFCTPSVASVAKSIDSKRKRPPIRLKNNTNMSFVSHENTSWTPPYLENKM